MKIWRLHHDRKRKNNRPQDEPATSSKSNETNNDIISPKNENVNDDDNFPDILLESLDDALSKKHIVVTLDSPAGDAGFKVTGSLSRSPTFLLYFLLRAAVPVFSDMIESLGGIKALRDIEGLVDGILELVKSDMLEATRITKPEQEA